MGIEVARVTKMSRGNKSAGINASWLEFTLTKGHDAIAYNQTRGAQVRE